MKKHLLIIGIIFLFLSSVVAPISTGIEDVTPTCNIDTLQDYYGYYSLEEIPESIRPAIFNDEENQNMPETDNVINSKGSPEPLAGQMDSPWPMYCHDTRHTGRSPYSTASNTGYEKWRIRTNGWADGAVVIDNDGVIYIGAADFYAVYLNGTLKWKFDIPSYIVSAAAIDENGIIYVGTKWGYPNYLYAIYTSDGTLKWKFEVNDDIFSSPAIG